MVLLLLFGVTIYFATAMFFFTMSATELIDAGDVEISRLVIAFFAASFWPATLIFMSMTIVLVKVLQKGMWGDREMSFRKSY